MILRLTLTRRRFHLAAILSCAAVWCGGCSDHELLMQTRKDNQRLRLANTRFERDVADRNARIHRLERQVATLQSWDGDRKVELLAPVKIEIVSRSRGGDYDDSPGDDGVTVYVRPIDADGFAVKSARMIRVKLLDLRQEGARLLGDCIFDDADALNRKWHGRFATNHYALECPFSPGEVPPPHGEVLASVEFVDSLTGATLTAARIVPVSGGD